MVRNTVVLVMIGLVAGTALAWARSATVNARAVMTIPALSSLSVPGAAGSGREILVSVEVSTETAVQSAEHIELRKAVVLVVRSNVQWTLVVRPTDLFTPGVVQVRVGSGEYRPVRPEGLVLAEGGPGVHEIVLDYRVNLDGGTGWSGGRWLTLAYAIEG